MIRVFFLLCLSLCFLKADAQLPWNYPGVGIRMKIGIVDSIMRVPSDTSTNKTGLARIGSIIYAGNGTFWKAAATVDQVQEADSLIYALQQALEDTAANIRQSIPSVPNELLNGCVVSQLTPTTYTVTAAQYRLGGVSYSSRDTTLTIAVAGDSARIDVFYVDTSSRARVRQGAMSSNPVAPSLNVGTELACSFVFVKQDSVVVPVTVTNYWGASGNNIYNLNSAAVEMAARRMIVDTFTGIPNVARIYATRRLVLQGTVSSGNKITAGTIGGNTGTGTTEFNVALGDNSNTSGSKAGVDVTGRSLHSSGNATLDYVRVSPVFNNTSGYGGIITGFKYAPSVIGSVNGTEYAWWSTRGGIRAQGLAYSTDTTLLGLGIDGNGNFFRVPRSSGGSGGNGVGRQELIDTANAIRSSLATFQAAMYDSLQDVRDAIPTDVVSQAALDDTAGAIRNYVTDNIRYIDQDSGIVMTVTGDTAKFSVDTSWFKRAINQFKGYKEIIITGSNFFDSNNFFNDALLKNDWGDTCYAAYVTHTTLGVTVYRMTFEGADFITKKTILNSGSLDYDLGGKVGVVPVIDLEGGFSGYLAFYAPMVLPYNVIDIIFYDETGTEQNIPSLAEFTLTIKTYE